MAISGTFQALVTALLLAFSLFAWIRLRSSEADGLEIAAWWTSAAAGFLAMQVGRDPNAGPLGWLAECAVDGLLVTAVATTATARDSRELHRLAAFLMPAFAWTVAAGRLAPDQAARVMAGAGLMAGLYLERVLPGQRAGRFAWYGASATLLWVDIAPKHGPDLGGVLGTVACGALWAWLRRTGAVDPGASVVAAVAVRGLVQRVLFGWLGAVPAGIVVDSLTMAGLFLVHARRSAAWAAEGWMVFVIASTLQGTVTLVRTLDAPTAVAGVAALQAACLGLALSWRRSGSHLGFSAISALIVGATSDIGRAHPLLHWVSLGVLAVGTVLPGNPPWSRMLGLQMAFGAAAVLSADRTIFDLLPTALVATTLLAHLGNATDRDRSVALATGCLPLLGVAFLDFTGIAPVQRGWQWVGVGVSVVAPAVAAVRHFPQAWIALALALDAAAAIVDHGVLKEGSRGFVLWGVALISGIGLALASKAPAPDAVEPDMRERTGVAEAQIVFSVPMGLFLFVGETTSGFVASIASGFAALLLAGHRRSLPGLIGGVCATLLPPNIAYLSNRVDLLRLVVLLLVTVVTVALGMTRRWRACLVGGLLSAVVIVHGMLVNTIGDGAMAATAAVVGLAAVLAGVRIEALRRAGQLPGWLDPHSEWV